MNAVALPAAPANFLTHLHAAFAGHTGATMPVRAQGFKDFLQRGIPTTRDEHWKYTNLRRLESREFELAQPGQTYALPTAATAKYQLFFVDGYYRPELSQLPTIAGLSIRSLAQLQATDATTLTTVLTSPANTGTAFAALNTALTQDGVLIDIAAHVALDEPLWLTFAWSEAGRSVMAHPRIVIRAGQHSQACVVEQYLGEGAAVHCNNVLTTLQLADGAQLQHCRIQNENSRSFHIGLLHAELSSHAQLTSHHINMGAALARMDINVFLQGAAASVSLNGLQFAGGNQHHDTHTRVEHCVPHTHSQEDYRGIADQRGRVVFNGKVVVREQAIKTDAQQSSRNLLLASTAEIDTKPELEIYNDDVKCAHGATVGQLDATALFYLRSRGLDVAQARALLTHAFAEHIIAQLPVAALREQLIAASHARFSAAAVISP